MQLSSVTFFCNLSFSVVVMHDCATNEIVVRDVVAAKQSASNGVGLHKRVLMFVFCEPWLNMVINCGHE
jgi:hypothetical protein